MESPAFINVEYIFYRVYQFFTETNFSFSLVGLWFWLRAWSYIISLPLFVLVVYLSYRIVQIRQGERYALKQILENTSSQEKPKLNPAWERVLGFMASNDPNDWRLAIIEADNMLDELVRAMNYRGESLGERLKAIEPSDFQTLNEAWEAHKVRNRIAHESGYIPAEQEARQAIARYRAVFEEFHFI